MAKILCIETSTKVCSAALSVDGNIVAFKEVNEENFSHAENLNVFIEGVLEKAGVSKDSLEAVAVSQGPGSYTGLRIGVSTAKGLCYGLNIPLIALSTLKCMAWGLAQQVNEGVLVPMIDARRMEVFCAQYDMNLNELSPVEAKVLDENSFTEIAETIHFFGDGSTKFETVSSSEKAQFHELLPSARWMGNLGDLAFQEGKFADTAYFEPFYLKDFVAGVPKKPAYLK